MYTISIKVHNFEDKIHNVDQNLQFQIVETIRTVYRQQFRLTDNKGWAQLGQFCNPCNVSRYDRNIQGSCVWNAISFFPVPVIPLFVYPIFADMTGIFKGAVFEKLFPIFNVALIPIFVSYFCRYDRNIQGSCVWNAISGAESPRPSSFSSSRLFLSPFQQFVPSNLFFWCNHCQNCYYLDDWFEARPRKIGAEKDTDISVWPNCWDTAQMK